MLDPFGQTGSWDGKTQCWRLAKSSLVVWLCPESSPSSPCHASDVLERLGKGFASVELSGSSTLLSLWWKAMVCIQRLNSPPPFPFSSCPNSLFSTHIQILSQGFKVTPRLELGALELESPTQAHFYMLSSTYLGSLALEIAFYLYFSIPGEASRINTV